MDIVIRDNNFTISLGKDVLDLSYPLNFNGDQLNAFSAPLAQAEPYIAGSFIGDLKQGGSCNCFTYNIIPHCNGSHIETAAHIKKDGIQVHQLSFPLLIPVVVISLNAISLFQSDAQEEFSNRYQEGDEVVIQSEIAKNISFSDERVNFVLSRDSIKGVVVNVVNYNNFNRDMYPPYFSLTAIEYLLDLGFSLIVTNLPSLDRVDDDLLQGHNLFFNKYKDGAIVELAYFSDILDKNAYYLSLGFPLFVSDVAPCSIKAFDFNIETK